jgi:hypothetical protein
MVRVRERSNKEDDDIFLATQAAMPHGQFLILSSGQSGYSAVLAILTSGSAKAWQWPGSVWWE